MAGRSKIEWCTDTWNPVVGCSITSPGCTNCYAMRMADRIEAMVVAHTGAHGGDPGPMWHYEGTTTRGEFGGKPPVWTGKIALAPDTIVEAPLRWRKPRRIFVNSMSDLFHEAIPNAWVDRVFAVMALCPQHTFQVLTKRAERMRAYLSAARAHPVGMATEPALDVGKGVMLKGDIPHLKVWPLPNVWLGVSAEDQRRADERVPDLLETPAAVRFVSAEPLLGPLDLRVYMPNPLWDGLPSWKAPELDWVIVGGESGPGARPMHPDWARSLRDQCAAAGVSFHFKQWGAWAPSSLGADVVRLSSEERVWRDGEWTGYALSPAQVSRGDTMNRVGKKAAGRLLDGVTHDGMPEVAHA